MQSTLILKTKGVDCMTFIKKIKISVCVGMAIALIFSVCSFAETSRKIRSDVLRLHIIANSDSAVDQNLKLRLRDYILEQGSDIFDGSVNVENAVEKIKPRLTELESTAREFVKANGFDYDVKITLSNEYFTTRTYDEITLPAGKYLALRVIIGSGEGHNWWCVMFPPMCVPAADKKDELGNVFSGEELELVEKNPKYEIRFKIVEVYEALKAKLS